MNPTQSYGGVYFREWISIFQFHTRFPRLSCRAEELGNALTSCSSCNLYRCMLPLRPPSLLALPMLVSSYTRNHKHQTRTIRFTGHLKQPSKKWACHWSTQLSLEASQRQTTKSQMHRHFAVVRDGGNPSAREGAEPEKERNLIIKEARTNHGAARRRRRGGRPPAAAGHPPQRPLDRAAPARARGERRAGCEQASWSEAHLHVARRRWGERGGG
jgi:hypothetical protein